MRNVLGLGATEMADIFDEWNRGTLSSFLIEITAKILRVRDPDTGAPLVDLILDKAGQKGTGRWTSEVALELGVVVPTINASVDARTLSGAKDERVEASRQVSGPRRASHAGDRKAMVAAIHDALADRDTVGGAARTWCVDHFEIGEIVNQRQQMLAGAFSPLRKIAQSFQG
mgnify:CR=1 FL=1